MKKNFSNNSEYINRELSWIEFNKRVLNVSENPDTPLFERLKFVAIASSNFDEFFMVRVSGLRHQVKDGIWKLPPDGIPPVDLLWKIQIEVDELYRLYEETWSTSLLPALSTAGVSIIRFSQLTDDEKEAINTYFQSTVYPILTPMAIDATRSFPFISNLSLNLAVVLGAADGRRYLARVKIPSLTFGRFIPVSSPGGGSPSRFILLEDLIAEHLGTLFPGMSVEGAYRFRVTRDAEIKVVIDDASDLLTAVEDSIECRRTGIPVRLEVDPTMPPRLILLLSERLGLKENDIYGVNGFIGHNDLWQLHDLSRPDLLDDPFVPAITDPLMHEEDIFDLSLIHI